MNSHSVGGDERETGVMKVLLGEGVAFAEV